MVVMTAPEKSLFDLDIGELQDLLQQADIDPEVLKVLLDTDSLMALHPQDGSARSNAYPETPLAESDGAEPQAQPVIHGQAVQDTDPHIHQNGTISNSGRIYNIIIYCPKQICQQ